jgi:hypothetical protein
MTPGPSSKEIGERIKRGLEEADREMSDADEGYSLAHFINL